MIVPSLARMLVRECVYKPITGKVLILGRQTIAMTYEQLIELLKQEKFPIADQVLKEVKMKYDSQTRIGKNTNYISDEVFFNLLGIKEFNVMDVSKYEGADIIHNLNEPIPAALENQFDFIIDGGTFDHLLDLRVAFENVVKLLKVGGRIFQWNAASNFTGAAYISLGPDFFYDFYLLNKFIDCKVYIAAVDSFGQSELWDLYEFSGNEYGYFHSKRILMTLVISEKGLDSTSNRIPIQAQYRDEHLRQAYMDRQKIISLSGRKSYQGSRFGVRVSKSKTNTLKGALINRAALKYQENGLAWIFKRCLNELSVFIKTHIRKEIPGYRYVGKI